MSTFYKDVAEDEIDQEFCQNFFVDLNSHHNDFIDQLNNLSDPSAMKKATEDFMKGKELGEAAGDSPLQGIIEDL